MTPPPPQAVLLIGIQATGKSTFARQRLLATHVHVSLDLLRTRHREALLLGSCLSAGRSFVVDNTNVTRADRARYIQPARAAGFAVVGYYFSSAIDPALQRNAARAGKERIPDAGLLGMHARLEVPAPDEGFDALHFVRVTAGGFCVEGWRDEVR